MITTEDLSNNKPNMDITHLNQPCISLLILEILCLKTLVFWLKQGECDHYNRWFHCSTNKFVLISIHFLIQGTVFDFFTTVISVWQI